MLPVALVSAQDLQRARGVAPENHAILSDTLSGSYFIAAPLKEQYNQLLSRLEALKRELDEERITGPQATARLSALRDELHKLREQIERTKVLVPIAKVHAVKESTDFELGPERSLLITADQVKLVSSEDTKVHCVLEKICLSVEDKPADAELAAIKLVHRSGPAPEIVGKTHKDLQDKSIDILTVEGLTHEQGNRQITLEANSNGAGRSLRSQWRRHAALTVHVPKCKAVIVQGSLRGLDVQGVATTLVVTSSGSHGQDYYAQFRIKGVRGNLTIADFPVNLVEDVEGDVSIDAPRDFANSGTQHANDTRLSYGYRPLECRCANIRGNLHARLGRVNLQLEGIHGRIDEQNDFGDTTLAIDQPLATEAHQLSSVSGRLEVTADQAALGKLPVLVATSYGTIRTNTSYGQFPEFHIGTSESGGRDWRGFRRAIRKADDASKVRLIDPIDDTFSPIDVIQGVTKLPGLVVLSQAGAVVFDLRDARR
jgi:hypothetical protein